MRRFHQATLGLDLIDSSKAEARFGSKKGDTLLILRRSPDIRPDDPREAGLFHVADLPPDRAALARHVGEACLGYARLRVGDLSKARPICEAVGFKLRAETPDAVFLGAGVRPSGMARLESVAVSIDARGAA